MSRYTEGGPVAGKSKWCKSGHVMPVEATVCPSCRAWLAEAAGDLLERLHLGLIPALEVGSVTERMRERVGA